MLRLWAAGIVLVCQVSARAQPANYDVGDPRSVLGYIDRETVSVMRDRDPVASRLRQLQLERLLAGLPANDPALKDAVALAALQVRTSRDKVYEQVTPLDVLIQKVIENLDDPHAVYHLAVKLRMEAIPLIASNPSEASRIVAQVSAIFDKVERAATNQLTKDQLELGRRWAANVNRDIVYSFQTLQRQQAKFGEDAIALKVSTWLNGSALSPADLQGYVLLLDFHLASAFRPGEIEYEDWLTHLDQLRVWQKRFTDRGLITIGITAYYNFRWNGVTQKPVRVNRAQELVLPVEEQTLWALLAQQHGLTNRLAILEREEYGKATDHYPAMAYPHLVVIDRQGKIRMIRGGFSAYFADDISRTLESLLGESLSKEK